MREHACYAPKCVLCVAAGEVRLLQAHFRTRHAAVKIESTSVLMPATHSHRPVLLVRGVKPELRLFLWCLGTCAIWCCLCTCNTSHNLEHRRCIAKFLIVKHQTSCGWRCATFSELCAVFVSLLERMACACICGVSRNVAAQPMVEQPTLCCVQS